MRVKLAELTLRKLPGKDFNKCVDRNREQVETLKSLYHKETFIEM